MNNFFDEDIAEDVEISIEDEEHHQLTEAQDIIFASFDRLRSESLDDLILLCNASEMCDMIKMFRSCRQHVDSSLECECYTERSTAIEKDDEIIISCGSKKWKKLNLLYASSPSVRNIVNDLYAIYATSTSENRMYLATFEHYMKFVAKFSNINVLEDMFRRDL